MPNVTVLLQATCEWDTLEYVWRASYLSTPVQDVTVVSAIVLRAAGFIPVHFRSESRSSSVRRPTLNLFVVCASSPGENGARDSKLCQELMANAPRGQESASKYWSRALRMYVAQSHPEEFALVRNGQGCPRTPVSWRIPFLLGTSFNNPI